MKLEQIKGTSKKTGQPFTGYRISIGLYKTPLFFPSEVELQYIKTFIQNQAHSEFKEELEND